ncbi:transposase [Dolichospermum sp. UHCC 0259]|uniref:transposase n=1 Tax=Dolichospermum sp. UHCC 0259 TaxID=2590010 RepID=UPI001447DD1D|nr:transposase [Dolichospermum sp. UHCC 0259]MTJ47723.1 transposase [Dolichospermum sp. UHCC 0259]
MKFDTEKHHRRSIRLPHYDYGQAGAYFVTICTYKKQCWFGDVKRGEMQLNLIGQIVVQEWLKSSEIRQEIELDEWVLMPNHLHGIVWIQDQDQGNGDRIEGLNQEGLHRKPLQSRSLGSLINGFKCSVTRRVNLIRYNSDLPFWQRNYYESIIRDETHLINIKEYIRNNPQNWQDDEENPHNSSEWQEILIDVRF